MQGLQSLLAGRLHRYVCDLFATRRLDQSRGVGTIGLVAPDVGPHVTGRQQAHRMSPRLEAAPPVMGAAAGLHDHDQLRAVLHDPGKGPPGQALSLQDPACRVGVGQLENVFCQINRDGRSMHGVDSSRDPVD